MVHEYIVYPYDDQLLIRLLRHRTLRSTSGMLNSNSYTNLLLTFENERGHLSSRLKPASITNNANVATTSYSQYP